MDFESLVQSQRPASYQIESDSSDEDHAASRGRTRPSAAPSVSVRFDKVTRKPVNVAIGPEGRVWMRGLRNLNASSLGSATLDGLQVAEAFDLGQAVLLLIHLVDPPLAALYPLAEALLDALRPAGLHIVDAYSVESYLMADALDDPPVRFLQSQHGITPEHSLAPFDVPNLASGIGAALIAEASRPSRCLSSRLQAIQRDIACSVAFLPSSAAGAFSVSTRRRPEGLYDPALEDDDGHDLAIYALQQLSPQAIKYLGWPDWDRTSLRSTEQAEKLWRFADAADLARRKTEARRFTDEGSSLYI